jgi:hypothetical protein
MRAKMLKMRSVMATAYTQAKTDMAHRTTAAKDPAAKQEPEWGDEKTIFRIFGLTRTPLFNLRKAGKIRSVSTAYGAAKYGKRLYLLQSVRDFLEAQERDQSNANKEGSLA